jgi:starch phosphorylase
MRESMARLTPRFSANRSVREYTEQQYLPAAAAYRVRCVDKGAVGRNIVNGEHALKDKWGAVHFGEVKVETRDGKNIFEVKVFLNGLDPKVVRVEIYADGVIGSTLVRQEMTLLHPLSGNPGGFVYSATVSAARPIADFTARVIPHFDGVAIPLEDTRILWQR